MALTNLSKKLSQSTPQKNAKRKFLRIFVILVVIFIMLYMPLRGMYNSSKALIAGARQVQSAAKENNLDKLKIGVGDTRKAAMGLNTSLNFLFWARLIPYFGGFYLDAKHFTNALNSELQAATIMIDKIYPSRNELGFSGTPTPGQDKIAQAVKVLEKITPDIEIIEPQLKEASLEVESIDVNKYPENFRGRNIRSLVATAKNSIIGAHVLITEGKDAIKLAPNALGANGTKNYLLLFQNDKELRPTGGFLTAYAFMSLDKGHLSATNSDDIYRLDEKLLEVCKNKVCPLKPPAPLVKYLPEADGRVRSAWSMRDSNISPDLPTAMGEFERMYKMLPQSTGFDGIITIDTKVVEEMIKITGPIDILGTTYSAETDKRCNCPNVIYELERYSQIIEKGEADRKAVLGILMQQLLARSLGASTEKMPEFVNAAINLANQKHIMFYMHESQLQQALSKFNWTGEVKRSTGDYLHINDANFAGGKSNLYVEAKVNLDVDDQKHKLTIEYKNPQPFNTWLNGINRDYVRIYVPTGSKLTSSKGSDDPVETQEDEKLDKTYFEAFITVRPQNSRTLSFEYTVPYEQSDKYELLIQKQPGARDHHYSIKVNGKRQEFSLTSDKQLTL